MPKREPAAKTNKQKVDEAIQGLIRTTDGEIGDLVQAKLDDVLQKNQGLIVLRQISAVLQGRADVLPEGYNFTAAEIAAFKFAPVVSCDVERSFSRYRAFLRDNRQSFLLQNIRKHMILHCIT